MILIDTSVLVFLINPDARPPVDVSTGQQVTRCKERIEYFIKQNRKRKILIPTPAYAEILVRAGSELDQVMSILSSSSVFKIEPFDESAAIECALLQQYQAKCGPRIPVDEAETWAKVKFDLQILSVGIRHGAKEMFSDDKKLRRKAMKLGIEVKGIADMPLPPEDPQLRIVYQEAGATAGQFS
ncbi:type II toxin-antitoxin system VapC family toxin [Stutzerimonas balearica]|uniref:type II toxin-antitoxin system VapC family toxin n=1 Tax=Stutzerimonas balearica TaxID=74829 RepID=UPI00190DDE71|nr:hypothetical protein [Stutzerimonas balearica]MBK3748262.1 hypothetical protein [Stutzerimonas balearica]MBK3826459.1 hypothetical protein [Stutzerimonas balearica]MBK3856149.1 hypothetical protein [Stutzerimonas balearica]